MSEHIWAEQGRGACVACKVTPDKAPKTCPARVSKYVNHPKPPTVDGAVGAWLDREWAVRTGGAQ